MILPFVARSTLDAMRDERDYLRLRGQELDARCERLTLQLANIAERSTPPIPTIAPRTRDEVVDAIIARAGSNGMIRAHLSHWAMRQRKAGVPDADLIPQILVWASPDDEDSPV